MFGWIYFSYFFFLLLPLTSSTSPFVSPSLSNELQNPGVEYLKIINVEMFGDCHSRSAFLVLEEGPSWIEAAADFTEVHRQTGFSGIYPTDYWVNSVSLVGDYAIVGTYSPLPSEKEVRIEIVNISTNANYSIESSMSIPYSSDFPAEMIDWLKLDKLQPNHKAILSIKHTNDESYMIWLNISDILNPQMIGTNFTYVQKSEESNDGYWSGPFYYPEYPYVYISGISISICVYNISNGNYLERIGGVYETSGTWIDTDGFVKVGDYILTGDGNNRRIYSIDVSDPANPTHVYDTYFHGYIESMWDLGNNFALAGLPKSAYYEGVTVFDYTVPSLVHEESGYRRDKGGTDHGPVDCTEDLEMCVFLSSSQHYQSDPRIARGVHVWDIRQVSDLKYVKKYTTPDETIVHDAKIRGNYVYLANDNDGLRVLRVGDLELRGTPPPEIVCGNFTVRVSVSDIHGQSNETSYKIILTGDCGSHGICNENTHECECQDGYSGYLCEIWSCYGINNTLDEVCTNGGGECVDINDCECIGEGIVNENILGAACNCSTNGTTWGPYCNDSICDGIHNSNTSFVCSGRGDCTSLDNCTCFEMFKDITYPENCTCLPGRYDKSCHVNACNGKLSIDFDEICSGHGECIFNDTCLCEPDYYGIDCNVTTCDESFSNTSGVCNGHGTCNLDTRICDCVNITKYTGDFCQIWSCYGREVILDPEFVCSGFGDCVDHNNCSCESGYIGDNCELWTCFDVEYWSDDVCEGSGSCFQLDVCTCDTGFDSLEPGGPCTEFECDGIDKDKTSDVCNARGTCTDYDICECDEDYEGEFCHTYSCGGRDKDDFSTCSGRGACTSPNVCDCSSFLYQGSNCEESLLLVVIGSAIGVVVLIVACCCFCSILFIIVFCFCTIGSCLGCGCFVLLSGLSAFLVKQSKKAKKLDQIKDVEMVLEEQKLEEDNSIAHLKINKNLFEIDYSDLKIMKILGEGGSNSTVYKSSWKGRIVAFKCFRTRLICSSQTNYDEFEREVEVLGSISHPNIIRYFGATLKAPRVGIVMEFCENGDLDQYIFINDSEKKTLKFEDKVRISTEVCFAMDYLHSRKIVHRDLKLENVLLDSLLESRVMDFGLSRIIQEMDQTKTKRVGTSVYMAPENFDPYGTEDKPMAGIELKVANDPSFRPKLEPLKEKLVRERKGKKAQNFLEDLIVMCWNHDPKKRSSFDKIGKKIDAEREILLNDQNNIVMPLEGEDKEDQKVEEDNNDEELVGKMIGSGKINVEETPVEGSLRNVVTDISSELDF